MTDGENKVVLKVGQTRLVLSLDAAVQVARLLWAQHLEYIREDYEKDPHTGTYGTTYKIKQMNTGDLAIEYISPTTYLAYQLNGDTK